MASTSYAAAVTNTRTNSCYDIFLSHRGPDTKNTFASYLFRSLVSHGFRVFLDKEELLAGDTLTSQIETAIKSASVHVAIFSPGYAKSEWCLNELLMMVESEAPIIPVFYRVQPTEVRRTKGEGVYAEALRFLEEKKGSDGQPRYNSTTVQNWRAALSKAAETSGLELERFNGNDVELLDKVVESVLKKLNKTRFDVGEYPTGLDEMIKDFENRFLLQQQSSKPQVIGIVGLGGIGKTTLVQELYNRKSSHYQRSCFLFDVREKSKSSLESLQKKLLLSSREMTNVQIGSVSEGTQKLRSCVPPCRALVVLDDVDHADQLDALLRPIRDALHSDSLILITSRDRDVLIRSKVEMPSIYKLTGLNPHHSKELFCFHAFTQRHPLPGFEDLVDKYLKACNGLPLSLKLFGALLYGNHDSSFWKGHLQKLEQILPHDIRKRLEISYHALERDEKEIFLDLACFFIGENKDTAIRIWEGFGWEGSLVFQTLQNKNLVEVVGTENEIRMHDHLRDLGRDLAEEQGLPRRIWRTEQIDDLLQRSSEVTEVRGISCFSSLPMPERRRWSRRSLKISVRGKCMGSTEYEDRYKMKKLQLLVIDSTEDLESIVNAVQSPNLIWLRWKTCGLSSLPSWIPLEKLRVLEVSGKHLKKLWRKESQAPLQLRELKIHAPLRHIPKSIGLLKHLEWISLTSVDIKMANLDSKLPNLEKLPEEFFQLCRLKHEYQLSDKISARVPGESNKPATHRPVILHGIREPSRILREFNKT